MLMSNHISALLHPAALASLTKSSIVCTLQRNIYRSWRNTPGGPNKSDSIFAAMYYHVFHSWRPSINPVSQDLFKQKWLPPEHFPMVSLSELDSKQLGSTNDVNIHLVIFFPSIAPRPLGLNIGSRFPQIYIIGWPAVWLADSSPNLKLTTSTLNNPAVSFGIYLFHLITVVYLLCVPLQERHIPLDLRRPLVSCHRSPSARCIRGPLSLFISNARRFFLPVPSLQKEKGQRKFIHPIFQWFIFCK